MGSRFESVAADLLELSGEIPARMRARGGRTDADDGPAVAQVRHGGQRADDAVRDCHVQPVVGLVHGAFLAWLAREAPVLSTP
ncbi:hypothetical protein [Nocardia callitridis]|uniref:Uncharacterized protein n=1 Tax=Nocardia callitridis TaxID=648753 RepID=A0ABP9KCB6_9NOCA